jgi:hypothetical protein
MRRARDGFWIIYHGPESIGEIKGMDQADWLIEKLKKKYGIGSGFCHATYPTSRPSFTGKDKTVELMLNSQRVQQ